MRLFRRRTTITPEQLIEAKHDAIIKRQTYREICKIYYSIDDAAGATAIVESQLQERQARDIAEKAERAYESLWQRYKKENPL